MLNRAQLAAVTGLLMLGGTSVARAQFFSRSPSLIAHPHGQYGRGGFFFFGGAYPAGYPFSYGFLSVPWYGGYPRPIGVASRSSDLEEDGDAVRPKLRVANAEATARARQFIDFGDARFGRQEFSEAYSRYRKAADAAPNLADAYFRQALAQAALGRYLPSVKSLRRGLAIDPDWPNTSFRLDQLYADNRAAKEMHLEQLALAAGKQPESAELLYLLGVEVFLDGQPARAKIFLDRAADLGVEKNLVEGFLEAASRQDPRRKRFEEL